MGLFTYHSQMFNIEARTVDYPDSKHVTIQIFSTVVPSNTLEGRGGAFHQDIELFQVRSEELHLDGVSYEKEYQCFDND